MNKINESLARFSSLISVLAITGLIGLVVAGFVFFAGVSNLNPEALGVALFLSYAAGSALSLAVFGVFLRLTAKVIVEGMNGNVVEQSFPAADITFHADDSNPEDVDKALLVAASKHDRVLKSLTNHQRSKWQRARRPDLSDYDGSISFSIWLKAQPGKW